MRSLRTLKLFAALSLAASGPRVLAQPIRAVANDSTTTVASAASSVTAIACPAPLPGNVASGVTGRVADPESLEPVAGAEVSLAWVEFDVSKETGIQRIPHLLHDSTNAKGAFNFCGLPSSMKATLQARKGPAATSEIPISVGDDDSQLFERTLLLSTNSAASTGKASVSGKVILEGGAPGAGSRVEVVGTNMVALTNDKGEFALTNVPSGTQVLSVRHLGYAATTTPVDLSARAPQIVTMKLARFVAVTDPVLVIARRYAALDKVGFNERRRAGFGYFLGPEQLRKMHALSLPDIFRHTLGLRVTYTDRGGEVVTSNRGVWSFTGGFDCTQYFVDDMPWVARTLGDVNNFVNAREIVAVEVYRSWNAPPQYVRDVGKCATIVLWTRFRIRDIADPNP